jgi:hypothetical protein
MAHPNAYNAVRRILLGQTSVTDLLLPQGSLTGLTTAPIFALQYPRKVAGAPATGYTGHDWAALLGQQLIRMVLITPSGRVASGGDTTRAPWSRPRMDVQSFGRTDDDAMIVHLAIEAVLKDLSNARAVLSTGTVLIRDVTIEGGPLSFPDPDTEAPEVVGIYAASLIEEFVA